MTTEPFGWAAALRPGTIVSFRFPLGEGEGPSKTHPCLVIAVNTQNGRPRITLAYGTSAGSDSNRGLDLDLSEIGEWKAAGLHRPTRFVLMRRVTVGPDDPGFNLHKAGGPVIGSLAAPALTALHPLTRLLGGRILENRRRGAAAARSRAGSRRATPCWQRRRSGRQAQVVVEYRRSRRVAPILRPPAKAEATPEIGGHAVA